MINNKSSSIFINNKKITCNICMKRYDGKSYQVFNNPILKEIRDNIIGKNELLPGPYGLRRLCYCDYTASGRPLQFIEHYISKEVMPYYANTHTEASLTGLQTNTYREDARKNYIKIIRWY